jgi:hypothetical protein
MLTVAANAHYEIDISNIREMNVTALKCISFLTDLTISSPDFGIDQMDNKDMPLIKHPHFCTTMWQISIECFSARSKAHSNMQCIQYRMEKVPLDVEYVKSKWKDVNVKNFLRNLVERMTKLVEEGAHLTQEACDTFDRLTQLINQVIAACKASKKREKENLTDRNTDKKKEMEETIKSKVEAKIKKDNGLQQEIERAERNLCEKIKYLDDIRKSKLHVCMAFLRIFGHQDCVGYAWQMLEEAEKRLKKTKEEAEKKYKRSNEDIQEWQDKQVELNKTLDQIEKLPTHEDDIRVLELLRDNCLGINRYFNQMRNYVTDVTLPRLTDFSTQVENVESNAIPIDELANFLQLTLESCAKTHHLAKMYFQCKTHLRDDETSVDIKELFNEATEGDIVNVGKM